MKKKVNRELKELINSEGWKRIEEALREIRNSIASRIIASKGTDEKIYTENDLWKRQVQVYNTLMKLPQKNMVVEEEVDIEEEIEKEAEEELMPDIDELFIQPE